jgi:hypothetical protein
MVTSTESQPKIQKQPRPFRPVLVSLEPKGQRQEKFACHFWVVPEASGLKNFWLNEQDPEKSFNSNKVFLQVIPQDLRVDPRRIPDFSSITLFGHTLKFDYNVPGKPNILLNCIVELESFQEFKFFDELALSLSSFIEIKGKIISGYGRLSDLEKEINGLQDPELFLPSLWPSTEEKMTNLTIGSNNIQIEIIDKKIVNPNIKNSRRQQFTKTSSQGRLWQLWECPEKPDLKTPNERLAELIDELKAISVTSVIDIQNNADSKEKVGIFYHVVNKEDKTQEIKEIVRPNLKILFQGITPTPFIPRTLQLIDGSKYQFLDYDEIEQIEENGEPAPEVNSNDIDVSLQWQESSFLLTKTPNLYFAGLNNRSENPIATPYIWQFGTVNNGTEEKTAIPSWIRYRIEDVPSSIRRIGDGWERINNLTAPFVIPIQSSGNEEPWRWTFDLPEREQATASPLRLRLTISRENIQLELVRPTIEAICPSIYIFNKPLSDPQSLPFSKKVEKDIIKNRLIFKNEGVSLEGYIGLKVGLEKVGLENSALVVSSKREGDAIAYRPAPEALIDLVPASGGNLKPEYPQPQSGPIRLPRDPNQGLVPFGIKKFSFKSIKEIDIISENPTDTVENPFTAIMALLPWVEWKGTFTQRTELILYHRNLVQEQAEFITSLSDRQNPDESPTSVFLPVKDFLKAVRDRFLQASTPLNPIGQLLNWLPGANLKIKLDRSPITDIKPQLQYNFSSDTGLPEIQLTFTGDTTQKLSQTLNLNQHTSWLDYNLEWSEPITSPTFILSPAELGENKNKLINSSSALLFSGSHIYDNLGVLRSQESVTLEQNNWLSEVIDFPHNEDNRLRIRSLYYRSSAALVNTDEGADRPTQIYFACENLKVISQVSEPTRWIVLQEEFSIPNAKFYLGIYGFYSTIHNQSKPSMTDSWIRVCGIPLFVTRLVYLDFEKSFDDPAFASELPKQIKLQAVLPNPTQVKLEELSNSQEFNKFKVPLFVQEAINQKKVIYVVLTRRGSTAFYDVTEVEGDILWNFSFNQQSLNILSGKLARLEGSVTKKDGSLVITINNPQENCFGSLFGQLWNLKENSFQLKGKSFANNLDQFQFSSNNPLLTLSNIDDQLFNFELDLKLNTQIKDYKLEASIIIITSSSTSQTLISLNINNNLTFLEAKLIQGNYFCLLPQNTDPLALILWIEKERDPNENTPPKLGTIFIQEEIIQNFKISIKGQDASPISLTGSVVRMTLVSSIPEDQNKVSVIKQEIYSGYFANQDQANQDKIELHIGEQIISYDNSSSDIQILVKDQFLSGYIKWEKFGQEPRQEFQYPVQFKVINQIDNSLELEFKETVFYAKQFSELMELDSSIGLVYPIVNNPTLTFNLKEAQLLNKEDQLQILNKGTDQFCLLKIDLGKWNLFIADPDSPLEQIPIDFCLDAEASQTLEKLPIRVPQLAHRNTFGTRLRINQQEIRSAEVSFSKKFPASGENKEYWLLRPIQDTTQQSGDRLVLQDETVAITSTAPITLLQPTVTNVFQTENLLLLFRDVSQKDISNIPKTFSLANLINITTNTKEATSLSDTNPPPILTDERIVDYLQKTGSVGVALRRTLITKLTSTSTASTIKYEFINSPFYDLKRSLTDSDPLSTLESLTTRSAGSVSIAILIDPRLLFPLDMLRWQFPTTPTRRYQLFDVFDANKTSYLSRTGDLPLRQIGYEKKLEPSPTIPDINVNQSEHLQLLEATAYEDAESPWFLPDYSMMPSANPSTTDRGSFQPKTLLLTYGLDKPGAMFFHRLQPCTVIDDQPIQIEPSVDFAIREPQQFKTPFGANIQWIECSPQQESEPTKLPIEIKEDIPQPLSSDFNLKRVVLRWQDTLGAIKLIPSLIKLKNPIEEVTDVTDEVNEILQIIVRVDQDLFEVPIADPILPISKSSPDIYLISKDANLETSYRNRVGGADELIGLKPKVVFYNNQVAAPAIDLLEAFERSELQPGGYFVWKNKGSLWNNNNESEDKQFEVKLHADRIPSPIEPIPLIPKKQLKGVDPLQLSPKIAVVMRFDNRQFPDPPQRTLIFGDAALPSNLPEGIKGWVINEIEGQGDDTYFKYRLQDEDTITIPFPSNLILDGSGHPPKNTAFYIIKYLVGGQTLFDVKKY